jgi:hypothetical protein
MISLNFNRVFNVFLIYLLFFLCNMFSFLIIDEIP